jgi:DNA-binding NtrC family response regulator
LAGLGTIVKHAIAAPSGFETEIINNALSLGADRLQLPPNGVLIVHLIPPLANELQALERVTQRAGADATPIIVISDDLDEAAIRGLLRLGVVDWLPVASAANEINAAFRRAMAKAEPDEQAQAGRWPRPSRTSKHKVGRARWRSWRPLAGLARRRSRLPHWRFGGGLDPPPGKRVALWISIFKMGQSRITSTSNAGWI